MKVEENVPFALLTTFKVGGAVRYVLTVETEDDVRSAVEFAKEKRLPLIPLGGGSNMLGVDGTLEAVLVRVTDNSIQGTAEALIVGAGAEWDSVVTYSVEHNWWGIENLSSIPGTMGGAVVQNIGAYGAVLSDTFVSVEAFDTTKMRRITFSRDQCAFGYRTSIFKQQQDRYIILSATLKLSIVPTPRLSYKDLHERFKDNVPTLSDIRQRVIEIRATKFPPLAEYGTAGSFFLNPIMSPDDVASVTARFSGMPQFALPEGGVKIPLGWFFEHELKLKGYREGDVEAWRNQALVIVAHQGATAGDVRAFAEKIIARADNELHIQISPEVRFL